MKNNWPCPVPVRLDNSPLKAATVTVNSLTVWIMVYVDFEVCSRNLYGIPEICGRKRKMIAWGFIPALKGYSSHNQRTSFWKYSFGREQKSLERHYALYFPFFILFPVITQVTITISVASLEKKSHIGPWNPINYKGTFTKKSLHFLGADFII